MKKNDVKIILIILIIASSFYLFNKINTNEISKNNLFVEIKVEGELLNKIPLSINKEFTIKTKKGLNKLIINDNTVNMIDANCKDKICVHHKAISKPGESIICLPNKIIVTIIGSEEELDAISQ